MVEVCTWPGWEGSTAELTHLERSTRLNFEKRVVVDIFYRLSHPGVLVGMALE